MEGATSAKNHSGGKRKLKSPQLGTKRKQKRINFAPARLTTTIAGEDGKPVNVVLVPTGNGFEELTDNADEVMVTEQVVRKPRIPPITVKCEARKQIDEGLLKLGISNYSIKTLRTGFNVYCSSAEDFGKARKMLETANAHHFTHQLHEEKQYKVVLSGLHKMDVNDLIVELKKLGLDPMSARVITPRHNANRHNCLYVIGFSRGTVRLADLKLVKSIMHTIISWEPYRHQGGIVQCARCQRPGHGITHCQMPPRCSICGKEHLSTKCTAILEQVKAAENPNVIQAPSYCCNCEVAGHYATDPKCPKRLAYIESRRRRASPKFNRSSVPNADGAKQHAVSTQQPALRYQTGGTSYADILNEPGSNFGPSGTSPVGPSGTPPSRPSGATHSRHSGANASGPSGNYIDSPFSMEELTSLTSEIILSLRNVQSMPRHEAMKVLIGTAMKYLYRND